MKSHEIVENPQNVIYSKEIQQTEKDFFNKYLNNLDKVVQNYGKNLYGFH